MKRPAISKWFKEWVDSVQELGVHRLETAEKAYRAGFRRGVEYASTQAAEAIIRRGSA